MSFARRLKSTIFEQHSAVFFAVTLFLLGLFAFAAVHEMVPGLCDGDDEEGDCPFCTLIYTLALLVCLGFFLPLCARCRRHPSQISCEPHLAHIRYAGWLRAPPAPRPA